MMNEFEKKAAKAISAEFHVISTVQNALEVLDKPGLPQGTADGRGTTALLQAVNQKAPIPSWVEVLQQMSETLTKHGEQVPLLSSSRMVNVRAPFQIYPESFEGTKRAVLIGISYEGKLNRSHQNVRDVHEFLTRRQGFDDSNIVVLMDDGINNPPVRANILRAYQDLVQQSVPGDVVYCHLSGHTVRLADEKADGTNGYNDVFLPLDFETAGDMMDEHFYRVLAKPMATNVHVTFFSDCSHAILDMPYRFEPKKDEEMYPNDSFDFIAITALAVLIGGVAAAVAASGGEGEMATNTDTALQPSSGGDAGGDGNEGCCEMCDCCSEVTNACSDCFEWLFQDCLP